MKCNLSVMLMRLKSLSFFVRNMPNLQHTQTLILEKAEKRFQNKSISKRICLVFSKYFIFIPSFV